MMRGSQILPAEPSFPLETLETLDGAMDLPTVQRAIEHAAMEFQVPATRQRAEATLLEFRNSAGALPACQHILDNSQDPLARFQAATAIRACSIREWGLMAPESRLAVRSYCLGYSIHRAAGEQPFVRAQMEQATASLLKRGWADDTEQGHEAFFAELNHLSGSATASEARQAGMALLRAVVLEFAPATASAMGLPWEQHERCRVSFERSYLQTIYVHGLGVAREVTASGAAASGADAGLCASAVALMSCVLSWDFPRGGGMGGGGFGFTPDSHRTGRGDGVQVQPGPAWREVLLAPENVDWLLQLLPQLKGRSGPLPDEARGLVLQLASLSGDIFPREGEDEAAARAALGVAAGGAPGGASQAHLQRMLQAALGWVWPAAAPHGDGEADLVAGCRALHALGSIHRAAAVDRAAPAGSMPGGGGALAALAELTVRVIQAGGAEEDADDGWAGAAMEELLEMWSKLAQRRPERVVRARPMGGAGRAGGEGAEEEAMPPALAEACGAVFQAYAAASLGVAARGAHEEDDGADGDGSAGAAARDERLMLLAQLARASPGPCLALLGSLIQERHGRLQQCAAAGADPSEPLEELCWLLRAAGHALADPSEGETLMVPDPLAEASLAAAAAGAGCPAEGLSRCILHVACLVLDEPARKLLSPRLMECAVWAAAHWAGTYLFPEKHHSAAAAAAGGAGGGALEAAFGPSGGGVAVLDSLVQVAQACLGTYRGEADLQEAVCRRLIPALARKPPVCERLVALPNWRALCAALSSRDPAVGALAPRVQRALAESLCRGAVGIAGSEEANAYVDALLRPAAAEVVALGQRPDLGKIAARPDVVQHLACLLECLRGGVKATLAKSQPAIFAVFSHCMDSLLKLLTAYRGEASVTCLLLKLSAELVAQHVAFLSPPDAQRLCQYVLALLEVYAAHSLGKVSVDAARSLQSERHKEQYKDLRALLRLLTCLTARDMVDFGAPTPGSAPVAAGPTVDVAQVVFLGLHILIPLISADMLKFPKLCRQYFRLLSFMLEVYPEKVATLPADAFRQLMSTLEYGLGEADAEVAQCALEALTGVARHHCKEGLAGRPGLGEHARMAMESGSGTLAHLMQVVLRRLLYEECPRGVVEQAADALLPLIICEPGTYQHVGESLLAGQTDGAMQAKLTGALQDLMGTNGVTHGLDRQNRVRFRKNVHKFVADVKGVVRHK